MSYRPSTLRDLKEITAKDVFDHAKEGDVLALEVVDFVGVGGGVIVDGKIVSGHFGAGGEIGHMLVNRFEERPCAASKKDRAAAAKRDILNSTLPLQVSL